MNAQSFIFIGRSGCGKGTQAQLLHVWLEQKDKDAGVERGVFYLQTGQELREFIQGNNPTQLIARKIYNEGELMPEFLTIYAWARQLSEKFNGTDHLIIDGTPRKLHEAGALHSIFSFYGRTDKCHVIYMNISEDEAVKRLMARGRTDDNPEDIRARLKWFETDVLPAVEYYRNSPEYCFHEINGEQSPEEVSREIMEALAIK